MSETLQFVPPIERRVIRYVCPFCSRGHSARPSAFAHIARCYRNPAAKSCKTCAAYQPPERADCYTGYPGCNEGCGEGEDLTNGLPVGCASWGPPTTAKEPR